MNRSTRFIVIGLGTIVVLGAVTVTALPLFLNADSFRARVESTLTKSLGRKVTVGKLTLSIWSGGLLAENTTIADDPHFSSQPFLQASSIKIKVQVLPLVLHKDVRIRGFVLDAPKVQLLRADNGKWNYSTIGSTAGTPARSDAETKQTFPDLMVGHVEMNDGQITVGSGLGASSATASRVYEQVNLKVDNFGFAKSFPFTASAHLPADGSVSVSGTAGPLNQQDAASTPFSVHMDIKHLDPLAAGLVDATAGISGTVDDLTLDAAWSGQQMHVTKLIVQTPHLTLVRSNTPKQPKPAGTPKQTSMLEDLSVDDAQVKDGTLTVTSAGQAGKPAVYQQVNAQVTNLTPKSWSPFSASAQLPGGGSLSASGKAGPFNQENDAATPVNAQISLKHVDLANSGIVAPDAGIGGVADVQAQVQSNGQSLQATGKANIAGIRLAKNGQPSAKPVQAQFAVVEDERALKGSIQHATVSVGRAVINLAGTYQTSGATTAIDIKADGHAVPIDEIEAFLPALGVRLPQGSRLQGGTVTTTLTVSGSTASPIVSGPVRLEGTQLAGFNLGAKLQSLSKLTGGRIGSATGNGTNIRSLSMDIREAGGGIRTDKVALDVAGVGTATGAGSVSEAGALDYNVLLKLTGLMNAPGGSAAAPAAGNGGGAAGLAGGLAGLIPGGGAAGGLGSIGGVGGAFLKNGIPVAIGGTTSNPTFAPNIRGLATTVGLSAAQNALGGRTGANAPAGKAPNSDAVKSALGGLFGKHK